MSQIAKEFITDWVSENATAEITEIEEDEPRAATLASQCRADAKADGIADQEFEDAIDDLTGGDGLEIYIDKAIKATLGEEALPLEEKDD